MAKHHPDLVMCMKQPGIGADHRLQLRCAKLKCNCSCSQPICALTSLLESVLCHALLCLRAFLLLLGLRAAIGRLCEKCDGRCPICDSYVRPATLVRICDECNYGSYEGRCVICGGQGISDAYYCKECTLQEKDVRISPCRFAIRVQCLTACIKNCAVA